MKRFLLACLTLCVASGAHGQVDSPRFFTTDSVSRARWLASWMCKAGDDPRWAAPELNDNDWTISATARIDLARDTPIRFDGIAWFRKHIRIDSLLVGVPLALTMQHSGASQIFLDGELLATYGTLTPRDHAEPYDPKTEPLIFSFRRSGDHLLAVRYAQWNARRDFDRWDEWSIGFHLDLDKPERAVRIYGYREGVESRAVMFLAVLFGALGFIHLLLWLFHRAARSNLPFALFSFCLSALFAALLLMNVSHDPAIDDWASRATGLLMTIGTVSLSWLTNSLFGRLGWRFRAIVLLGLVAATLDVLALDSEFATIISLLLFILVLLETVVLTVRAILRRVPGARIIGAGVVIFSLLVLTGVAVGIAGGGLQVSINPGDAPVMFAVSMASILALPVSMSAYLAWNFGTVSKRLTTELRRVEALSERSRRQEEEKQRLLESRQEELEREVHLRTGQLRAEKQKSDDLLLNILPEEVAEELKMNGQAQARLHDNVTVFFTDFVNFTPYSERLTPAQIVAELDDCFKVFDAIVERHGLEKIKTIGDAYMAVAGLPLAHTDGAAATVRATLDIRDYIQQRRANNPDSFDIRIGVHSGPVVAGIIGVKKFAYDVWGDTVNIAARMEQSGAPGKVNISTATYALVKERFSCTYRGEIAAKGKGTMAMYFVETDT